MEVRRSGLSAPGMMHFQRSKSTLDSVKSVLNVFRTKPSIGAPENVPYLESMTEVKMAGCWPGY